MLKSFNWKRRKEINVRKGFKKTERAMKDGKQVNVVSAYLLKMPKDRHGSKQSLFSFTYGINTEKITSKIATINVLHQELSKAVHFDRHFHFIKTIYAE
jgi:hypothetical protein